MQQTQKHKPDVDLQTRRDIHDDQINMLSDWNDVYCCLQQREDSCFVFGVEHLKNF